jgi:hypothetical protein
MSWMKDISCPKCGADRTESVAVSDPDIAYKLVCIRRPVCDWVEIERYSQLAGPDDMLPDTYYKEEA